MIDLADKKLDFMALSERDFIRCDVARQERAAGNFQLANRILRREADDHFPIYWRFFMADREPHGAEYETHWDRLENQARALAF